jgi:Flp pilus assembly protein CpaB
VSRRARAVAFGLAALACAGLAASVAGRYRSGVTAQYGGLRPVVVTAAELEAGQTIGRGIATSSLVVRRVPGRFVPPGALRRPADALGRAPGATVPAGSYLLAAQLAVPQPPAPPPAARAGRGRRPVQVGVTGAEALLLGGASPEGSRVDVVVSEQSGLGRRARTYVAATGVRLLALSAPPGPGEGWSATLALTRPQALELIAADAGAREVRLLAGG